MEWGARLYPGARRGWLGGVVGAPGRLRPPHPLLSGPGDSGGMARLSEVMEDPWVRSRGLIISRDHDGLGLVDQVGVTARLSRTPAVPGCPAPLPGADGRPILEEHGLGADVERLVDAGAVVLPD